MLRAVYKRPVDRKTACRRHRFAQADTSTDRERLVPGLCLCHVCPWLTVELWRCSYCGPGWLRQEGSVYVCPVPTKATKDALVTSSGLSLKRSTMFDGFPEIWAFLTSTEAPDGSRRMPGTLSLSSGGGVWTLSLTDPSTNLYSSLCSQDLDTLIVMVESRLSESSIPWRVSKYPLRGSKKSS